MWGQDHIGQAFQRVGHFRFVIEHIQRRAGDSPVLQGIDQVGGGDHAGPGNVHQKTVGPQGIKGLFVDQLPGIETAWRGDDEEVRDPGQFRGRGAEGVGHVAAHPAIVVVDAHVKAQGGPFGNRHAHRAKAQHTQALAGQGRARGPRPFTPTQGRIRPGNVAYQRQQQRHGMVSHRGSVDPGTVSHHDVALARSLQVHLLVAGTDHADDLQVGQGGDLFGRQTQGAAGQHRAEPFTVFENRRLAFGRRWRQFQVVALPLENR
ncbi:UNVERIFIED_ORG: hypothetical protein J2Y77_001452 [Pseudomonas lini]